MKAKSLASIREETALDLWRQWFSQSSGIPWAASDDGCGRKCFFCGECIHTDDCVFVKARRILMDTRPEGRFMARR